ncbi:MAG: DUF3604 domain-containing protein [Alphaproteobacteria bacterium]|nr:DUF3604 domain-containing protein [Alphaproteobacteria bacterium]
MLTGRWSQGRGMGLIAALGLLAALGLAVWSGPGPSAGERADDYLSADLRQEVESLKAALDRAPTSANTLVERAQTLYAWANRFAQQGWEIHPDLPSVVSSIIDQGARGRSPAGTAAYAGIDDLVREMTFREANPDAIGALSSDDTGPFAADGYATLAQTYTVGASPIRPGGGLMFTPRVFAARTDYQTTDPAAPNYLSVSSSNPDVEFEVTTHPFSGTFSGMLGGVDVPQPFFRVRSGQLGPGDRVTLTLGDTSQGSPGYRVPSFSTDGLRLRVWVRLEEAGPIFPLKEVPFEIGGASPSRVAGFAPAIVRPGERFELTIRTEDVFRNRASGSAPAYVLESGGATIATTKAGAPTLDRIEIGLTEPGPHHIRIRSVDGAIEGWVTPILVAQAPRARVFWGETHGHTGFAEGNGTVDGYYSFARDDARLDFAVLSEHDLWMDDQEWDVLVDAAQRWDGPGFAVYLGYEYTAPPDLGGHHNVAFRTNDGRRRVERQRAPRLPELFERLKAENDPEDVIVIPHAHNPGDWMVSDPDVERLIEIVSEHGTFEWLGRRYLQEGHPVGFIGASDNHIGHPGIRVERKDRPVLPSRGGLAAVLAPEHDRDMIFDAMRERAAYATNGARIILDVSVNGTGMGGIAPAGSPVLVEGEVVGSAPIESISIVKNGQEIETISYTGPRAGEEKLLQIAFFSEADPQERHVPSRAWRIWRGSARFEGVTLEDFHAPHPEDPHTPEAGVSQTDRNTGELAIRTRGTWNFALARLKDAGPDARLQLDLRPRGEPQPIVREIALSALDDGPVQIEVPAGANTDLIRVGWYTTPDSWDRAFRFEDASRTRPGDTYYVRIKQADGGLAWSSPIWIDRRPGSSADQR